MATSRKVKQTKQNQKQIRSEPASKPSSITAALRMPAGKVDLSEVDPRATPGFDGGKTEGTRALVGMGAALSDLQERLFAEGRTGGQRRVLLVLQGMDTSGKGGVMRHSVGLFDPQGVRIKSFAAPTRTELRHDFLWRVRRELPPAGLIGIFDRSHYEDVLIGKVRKLVPATELRSRYKAINDFERELVDAGTVLVKAMLHISPDKQKERLLARLDDPTKHWKYNPGDIDERALWSDYKRAYEVAIEKTNSEVAPWLVVPSDRKWYRNWAIGAILLETLERMGLVWPDVDFDADVERRRLLESAPS